MISCGIDAGSEYLKVVLLDDGRMAAYSSSSYERDSVLRTAEAAIESAVVKAGIARNTLQGITATGSYGKELSLADSYVSELVCCCRGAHWLLPSVKTVIDLGSEKCTVVRCDGGTASRIARGDRCAAGTGTFLTAISRLLQVSPAEAGELSLNYREPANIDAVCTVFVESEIISLIHQGKTREDILRGAFLGLAQRIYPLLLKVAFTADIMLIGGLARNAGIIDALHSLTGKKLVIPEEPIIVNALGAALTARENTER